MIVLDGKIVAAKLSEKLILEVLRFKEHTKRAPHLVVVIVGEDPASQVYVKNKDIACRNIGIDSTILQLPEGTLQQTLDEQIKRLNQDDLVDAVLVQFPLPKHLSKKRVLDILSSSKDADGLTHENMGALLVNEARVRPCTPHGVMKILNYYNISLAGKNVVVVGRSQIVGKPMAIMLSDADATVTICHSKSINLKEFLRNADIVVVAAGKPLLFGKNDFKKKSIIVDVGIHRLVSESATGKKLCGDVRFEELEDWAFAATPVPGGVGPMTIACLLENTIILAQQRKGVL